MWEFFKRALQLYRVPLTPEGEELLRVHRNETRELVHMLLPLLTDKQMKTAAHAVGAGSRAVYKVLQRFIKYCRSISFKECCTACWLERRHAADAGS